MELSLSADEKIALIKENLQEILKPEIIEDVIKKQNRPLVIYWGTATTGRPHCAYFVPILKIAQFLQAGCKVKILLADLHGFLDNLKAPLELVQHRAEYYKFIVSALLKSVNVPIEQLEWVLGSSYQTSHEYTMDFMRLSAVVTYHDATKAGTEVVKQVESADSATLSSFNYPVMQALDEEYLGVDAQFGGVDQRKIFTFAAKYLPKLKYKQRAHMMNAMVPGLAGGKMSSSDPDSKIDVLEEADVIRRKIKKAHAVPKEVDGNGIISFVEYILLPVSKLKNSGQGRFVVERREGESLVYNDIASIKRDYEADELQPQMLKSAVTNGLIELLKPIQDEFQNSQEWKDIEKKAYPPPMVEKKEKKAKNLGSRFPGAVKEVEAKPDGHLEGPTKSEVNLATDVEEAMKNLDVKTNTMT